MTDFDFDRLGEELANEQDALLAKRNVQAEVRARLAGEDLGALRKSARRAATRRVGLFWGTGGAALATAAVALVLLRGTRELPTPVEPAAQALSVQLSETHDRVEVGQYVHVPPTQEVGLEFSDGSHIAVAEHSRVRLTGLRMNGADVSLESGQMHVQVKHRTDTSWHISAGPFGVHVIGTRFEVRWKPEDDNFELTLHEGKVELSGCAFSAGYRMLAGQTVRTSCKNGRFDIDSASEASHAAAGSGSVGLESISAQGQEHAEPPAPEQPEQPAPAPAPATDNKTSQARPASAPAEEPAASAIHGARQSAHQRALPDFRALARAGRYADALGAAKAAGFEQACAGANARELSLLATAARHGQDTASEVYALRLLRDRFRGTKDASLAAFALGRIEFDNHGAYAKAAEWFRTYLTEQPQGELTREALGRLLEATQHQGEPTQVRELASRYLSDYPEGPHAGLARRLLQP